MTSHLQQLFRTDPHRLLTTAELVEHGYRYDRIISLCQQGILDRLEYGLHTHADEEAPPTQRAAVPLRYMGQRRPDHHQEPALTGPCALGAHDVGEFHLFHTPMVVVDPNSRVRPDKHNFDLLRRPLACEDVEHVKHLPTAPLGMCLADTAADVGVQDKALRLAVQDIRLDRLLEFEDLVDQWRAVKHEGARRLNRLLAEGEFDYESEGERRAFKLLFEQFPPWPDCQVHVLGRFRVDFVFISAGLIIEYHGKDAHAGRVDEDATRIHALEAAGWRVIVVTVSMLRDAKGVAAHIHQVRREREHRIAAGELPQPALAPQPGRVRPLRTLHPRG